MTRPFHFHDPHCGRSWDCLDYFHNGWLYGPTGYEAGHVQSHTDRRDWTYTNPYSCLYNTTLPYRHSHLMADLRRGVERYVFHADRRACHRLLGVIDNAIRTMSGFCGHGRCADRVVQFNRRYTDGSVMRMEGSLPAMADNILSRWTQVVCRDVLDRTLARCGLDVQRPDQKRLPVPEIWNRVFVEEFFSDLAAREPERWESRTFSRRGPRPEKALCCTIQLMREWEAVWYESEKLLANKDYYHR
ncbi:hypothetical protein MN608_10218 [Microdochium nivale]|nr:hypothetical protein MN608_10218 [Microdochium nivale]